LFARRSASLFVAFVAHVDDAVPLAGAGADLVVHLGDEWAHRVDDVAATFASLAHHLGGGTVGGEHHRTAHGNLGDVIDEHDAELAESVDHDLVVDDLVVAVHRRIEAAHHPRERLDGHLHSGAEATGRSQENPIDVHGEGSYRCVVGEGLRTCPYPWR